MNNPKTLSGLCAWLRQNSSGVYRPSKEAATVIEALAAKAGVSMETSIFDFLLSKDETIEELKRYRTPAGDKTCARSFHEGHVCDFLVVDGPIGYCAILGGRQGPVIERERGMNLGFLVPHKDCPLWSKQ